MRARDLLSVRGMLLSLLAVVLVSAMVWLGVWQLGVYDRHQRDDAAAALHRTPAALDDLLGPDQAFGSDAAGRPVTATGEYLAADQFYVRDLAGSTRTYAVVTPLLTESGSAVLVVRGSSDTRDAPPPDGVVSVTGVLEPSQSTGSGLDAERVTEAISIPTLVSSLSTDVYSGYLIATSTTPADHLAPVSPPSGQPSRLAGIRNLIYAFQWWIFAGFVVFMWWRVMTDRQDESTGR